ncbi:Hsp20/alpha crystallin family protein [Desulfobacca acetoxidans]|uniref:Heat shock protein Hsp20 n=1 Tax=Desulfobacca acetoxidans (strain ATCC 700848 / DSM 11109 / ASRB2) TaxID=880072 RepID=F2NE19_DESAR|nr:Hsp20/alpha crystallin family protein [Desulfobacca acetoxidans]AEB10587.1 heat shock protein Hsp20 [Desulfobacca acetoxidans DSM 11109]HAY21775.1 Hsp20/alpha crystallin family protein [Desulfobacterales bacterium]
MADKELQPKEKEAAPVKMETTRPGRVFLPAVDIYETPEAIVLLADMPGVASDKVNIDLKEDQLTISGEISPPMGQGEHLLVREYDTGNFLREFTLGQIVDQSRIEAAMKDGVLRLVLPKVERAKPRKIEVKTA